MMNRIRIAAAVLLAVSSAPLAAQKEAGETVRLRFGWQPGMRAEVTHEQIRLRSIEGREDSVRAASSYQMEVSRHASGLALTYSRTRWTELPAADPVMGGFYEALNRTASGGRARSVVSRRGEFLRVEGAEAVAREIDQAVQPLLSQVEEPMLGGIRTMISTLLSPEAIHATALDEWSALVGAWIDAELEVGEVYAIQNSIEMPLFPGEEIPLNLEFRAVGRVPCTPEESERLCVELGMSSAPDREVMARVLREFLQRAGAPEAEVQAIFAQLNVQTFVTLRTEPGTLRPHFMQVDRVVIAGSGPNSPRQTERRTLAFRWLP